MSWSADWTAQMDQMQAALRDLAKLVAGYQANLVAQGLPPEDAHRLAIVFQATVMGYKPEQ